MQPTEPKQREAWRPRIDRDSELNPSVRVTMPSIDERTQSLVKLRSLVDT
jgi:hypothetical protein